MFVCLNESLEFRFLMSVGRLRLVKTKNVDGQTPGSFSAVQD